MVALALIAILLPCSALITRHWLHTTAPDVAKAFMVFVGLISLSMPGKIYQAALRGLERVDCEQALDASSTLARTILSVLALAAGFKLVAIAWINGCSALGAAILAYPLARHVGGLVKPSPHSFSWRCLHTFIRPSAAFLALQAGATLTLGIDNLVIGATLGGIAVTRYAVPFRLIWMASLVFVVAVNAAMPTISGRYVLAQRESLDRHYLIALRAAMLFATSGAILLWLVGPYLIGLWAGPGVFPSAKVFALQIVLFAILVLTSPARAILAATTNHYWYAVTTIAEGLLNLTLSILWVHRYGLAGVIAGTIVASLLTTAWYVSVAAPAVIGLARMPLFRSLALPMIVSGSALSAEVLTVRSTEPYAAVVIGCVIVAIVLLAYLVLVFDASERRAIYRFFGHTLDVRPDFAGTASV
jgi:O-antigen/teichoic acid export membrane protein